ncbi:MAG: hypothetical protein ACR2HF_14185, partial [Methylococcaceae bacterium]
VRLLSFFKTHDSQSESRGADLSDRGRYADASSTPHSKSGGRSKSASAMNSKMPTQTQAADDDEWEDF